jgi:hypothetical protein
MRGRPWPTQHAVEAPPCLTFLLHEEAALRRIRRAGAAGIALGDDLSASLAIRLALAGHVTIDRGTPQRARAKVHAVST